ncbi:MAG: tRNA-dihydrouridine synthase family protein [Verrucomicrobia bacterium]|nr:tRNA-dihydrouridine synthase family protein [Verrucomicrobiota bacterium]
MAGYTDAAFRSVCKRFGCSMGYTEVAVAQGLIRGSKPSWHLLETVPGERPIAGHIYGSDPDVMARTAAAIEATGRFDLIDINCGCPVRKIVAKGAGAALIRDPNRIGEIVRAVRAEVSLPVTVKTRIGFDAEKPRIREIAEQVETGGAHALAIHGRYAAHHHRGDVDWELIAEIKTMCRIPVIGNGGVFTAQEALRRLRESGVDGIMIARGAVGQPWIFDDIARLERGEPIAVRRLTELRDIIEQHLAGLVALKKIEGGHRRKGSFLVDRGAATHFRCHLIQYLSGLQDWADIRRQFNDLASSADIMEVVDAVFERQHSDIVPSR